MGLPIGQLVLGASRARNAYVGGQQDRQKDDLAQALMARKMERETQEQSLRDALTRSQTSHNDALSASLRAPKQDEWDRFETADGWVEQNKRTREVRPINAPSAPSAPVQAGAPSVAPTGGPSRIDEITGDDIPTRGFEAPQTPGLPTGPLTQSRQLQSKKADRAPVAQQHVVDPVTGEVKFFDPTAPPQGLRVNPAPKNPARDPLADHRANREFDIAHPLPPPEGARPTEPQEKSHLFYNLMKNAEPQINSVMGSKNIRPAAVQAYLAADAAGKLPMIGGVVGALARPAANEHLNADEQLLIRAGKEFTAGVLRKESGAAVTPSELMDTMERYFPGLYGDKPELTEAKATARAQYMETMKQQASPAIEYYEKRGKGDGASKSTITPAERKALKAKGWTDAEIDAAAGRPDDE